ncbi:hypothetical protein B0H17DRAFT_1185342 [Mycena rosella]|uniref:Uncharacterized protein n=1 Tax=Mycena rosella TaxID=1033263 RepID=A0AAD7CRZ0_MYCRO|nr:hypothetical protein B0H17DRAFT_1185342 [Mycena rosella]
MPQSLAPYLRRQRSQRGRSGGLVLRASNSAARRRLGAPNGDLRERKAVYTQTRNTAPHITIAGAVSTTRSPVHNLSADCISDFRYGLPASDRHQCSDPGITLNETRYAVASLRLSSFRNLHVFSSLGIMASLAQYYACLLLRLGNATAYTTNMIGVLESLVPDESNCARTHCNPPGLFSSSRHAAGCTVAGRTCVYSVDQRWPIGCTLLIHVWSAETGKRYGNEVAELTHRMSSCGDQARNELESGDPVNDREARGLEAMAIEQGVLRKSGTGANAAINAVQERGVTIEGSGVVLGVDAKILQKASCMPRTQVATIWKRKSGGEQLHGGKMVG